MKLKLNTELKNYDGEPIKDEENKAFMLAEVLLRALLAPLQEDMKDSDSDRLWKWEMAQTIHKNREGDIELKPSEADKLKDRVRNTMPSPAIYGNVREIIDQAKQKEKTK